MFEGSIASILAKSCAEYVNTRRSSKRRAEPPGIPRKRATHITSSASRFSTDYPGESSPRQPLERHHRHGTRSLESESCDGPIGRTVPSQRRKNYTRIRCTARPCLDSRGHRRYVQCRVRNVQDQATLRKLDVGEIETCGPARIDAGWKPRGYAWYTGAVCPSPRALKLTVFRWGKKLTR